jgi:hypothetical protein
MKEGIIQVYQGFVIHPCDRGTLLGGGSGVGSNDGSSSYRLMVLAMLMVLVLDHRLNIVELVESKGERCHWIRIVVAGGRSSVGRSRVAVVAHTVFRRLLIGSGGRYGSKGSWLLVLPVLLVLMLLLLAMVLVLVLGFHCLWRLGRLARYPSLKSQPGEFTVRRG